MLTVLEFRYREGLAITLEFYPEQVLVSNKGVTVGYPWKIWSANEISARIDVDFNVKVSSKVLIHVRETARQVIGDGHDATAET